MASYGVFGVGEAEGLAFGLAEVAAAGLAAGPALAVGDGLMAGAALMAGAGMAETTNDASNAMTKCIRNSPK
jgi:hypothetical protein